MTRQKAAQKIAEKLNAEGYEAKVWTGGSVVRVYVKSEGEDCGYLTVGADRKATEKGCSSIHGCQGGVSRHVCSLFGKHEEFADAPAVAEETFEGVPYWKIRKAAKEGTLATLLTAQQIADAVRTGVVSESSALNQDA